MNRIMKKLFLVSLALLSIICNGQAAEAQTIYDDPYNQVRVNTLHNEDGQLDGTFWAYVSWGGGKELHIEVSVSKTQLTIYKCQNLENTQYVSIRNIENDPQWVTLRGDKWTARISKKSYQKARVMEVRKSSALKDAMVSLGYNEVIIAFPGRRITAAVKETINDLRYDDMIYQCTEADGNYWKVYIRK
ncbi:MAG: hypothetical protein AB2L14_11000 [Candidatus Xenobiia bacterium LiM19]